MGDENYIKLVSRISQSAGLSVEDIERRVEAKRAKLSGLVSKEGAAQIVAAELGINFDQERMKISELMQGMRRANVIGKILEVYPVRDFNKNGREGRVCNLLISDESSNTRAVLWDTHHIELIEKGKLKKGDVIEIANASVKNGELHLNSFSDIKKSKEVLGEVVMGRVFNSKRIKDLKAGDSFKTRAVIVKTFEPRYFEVCPQCGKKAVNGECSGGHGKIEPKKRALLNIILDDGSENIRAVMFGDTIKKLGFNDEEIFNLENFAMKKDSMLGDEKYFSGNVRTNAVFNTTEMNIEDIGEINSQELIEELGKKA